jgi:predicted nucleic acid-binding protein
VLYLDTSAFLKTVWHETESDALSELIGGRPTVSSTLLAVEARRSTIRVATELLPRTDLLLGAVEKVALTDVILESAGLLPDPTLRTLGAIHLATALLIREDIEALLTYDDRLAAAARSHGIEVAAPS